MKSGSVTSSIVATNARLASSLPAKSASRGIGASSKPSSAPFSRSTLNPRFIATIAASAKVTQSTLGASTVADTAVGSRAKLKITSTSAAKTSARQQRGTAPELGPDVLAGDGEGQIDRIRHRSDHSSG